MPVRKLRDYLAQVNPPMDFRPMAKPYISYERSKDWPEVLHWSEWDEFNTATIENVMGPLLNQEFDLPQNLGPGPKALLIAHNEAVLEFEIIRHNNVILNAAVDVIAKQYPSLVTRCWASGYSAACNSKIGIPDWAVISLEPLPAAQPRKDCICPGDTKYYDKNTVVIPTSSELRPEDEEGDWWAQKCLRQVCHYAVKRKTRYFYLLTPEGAFVGRRGPVKHGNMVEPEIALVPWDAKKGELNVNTALLFLFIIAGREHNVLSKYDHLEEEYVDMFPR